MRKQEMKAFGQQIEIKRLVDFMYTYIYSKSGEVFNDATATNTLSIVKKATSKFTNNLAKYFKHIEYFKNSQKMKNIIVIN